MSSSTYTKVHVRSVDLLPTYDSHCRGGHRWSKAGRTVMVTSRLLQVLRKCKRTAIDLDPQGEVEAEPLDLIVAQDYRDPLDVARQEKRELERELEAERAEEEAAKMRAELAELRAKKAAAAEGQTKSKTTK